MFAHTKRHYSTRTCHEDCPCKQNVLQSTGGDVDEECCSDSDEDNEDNDIDDENDNVEVIVPPPTSSAATTESSDATTAWEECSKKVEDTRIFLAPSDKLWPDIDYIYQAFLKRSADFCHGANTCVNESLNALRARIMPKDRYNTRLHTPS